MPTEYILTKIEQEVVDTLAKYGPKSGYDFHLAGVRQRGSRRAIMSSGHWPEVVAKIGSKGLNLIQQINSARHSSDDQRGRRKDLYWLTENGIGYALTRGIEPALLLENVKAIYPGDERKAALVDTLSKFPLEVRKNLLCMAQSSSQLGHDQFATVTLVGPQTEMMGKLSAEQVNREMISTLKKYPEVYGFYRKSLRGSFKQLKRLIQITEADGP